MVVLFTYLQLYVYLVCAVLCYSWRRTKVLPKIWQKENSLFQSFTVSEVIQKTIRSWISLFSIATNACGTRVC